MSGDAPDRKPADEILDSALDPGGEARSGCLAEACGRDAESPSPALVGKTVGRYHILSELGRGGMAVVYLAERVDAGFQQQVALKILQSGVPSADKQKISSRKRAWTWPATGESHPATPHPIIRRPVLSRRIG